MLILSLGLFAARSSYSARADSRIDFDREIRPILSEYCYACHGPDAKARKADLRLDRKEDAFRDRSGYAVIVPGKVEESELIARITSDDPDESDAAAEIQETAGCPADRSVAPVDCRGGEVGGALVLFAPVEHSDTAGEGRALVTEPDRSLRAGPPGKRGIAPVARG